MEDLHFPIYSYTAFKDSELEYTEPEDLREVKRYDYINLTRIPGEPKRKMLKELLDNYLAVQEKGFEYKDYILHRYYYKQFVIKETTDDGKQTRYFKYILSDWDEESKKSGLDDRVLTIEIYTKLENNEAVRDVCYKLKVGHKEGIIDQINGTKDKYDEFGNLDKVNLYIIPLYFVRSGDRYERISTLKSYDSKTQENVLLIFLQAIHRFIIFNLYMLSKAENNTEMTFMNSDGSFEVDNLVSYMKRHATSDKHVVIRDFKYNLSIKMDPSRSNIYSHDNVIIRTLCDYRHQVHAHYQHYWKGSKKDGTRHREYIWKESYERNKDKPYKVIKEHEKDAENDNQKFE